MFFVDFYVPTRVLTVYDLFCSDQEPSPNAGPTSGPTVNAAAFKSLHSKLENIVPVNFRDQTADYQLYNSSNRVSLRCNLTFCKLLAENNPSVLR